MTLSAVGAPGGAFSVKGFVTIRIPPWNTFRGERSSSSGNGRKCCTKNRNGKEG